MILKSVFIIAIVAVAMIGVMVPSVFTPNEAYADSFKMFAKDAETDGSNSFTELDGARGVDTFVIGGSTYAIVASS